MLKGVTKMDKAKLQKAINESDTWNIETLNLLAEMAEMKETWKKADGENFEQVIYKMAEKIGIQI